MKMHKHKEGFAHLWLLLIVVLAAIFVVGYVVWERQADDDGRPVAILDEPATPCPGRFYDSHAHPDDDAVIASLPALMGKYDVGCSVLFTQLDINDVDSSLLEAREYYSGMPGRIAVFYDVIEDTPAEVTRAKLDDLWQQSGGKFTGFGEFAFYEESFRGRQLTDEGWPAIFEFAAEKDLVIMIHPQKDMVASLEEMLTRYPEAKVLIHGFELPNELPDLLKKHANLYFTLDTATMFVLGELTPDTIPEHLFYPGGGPNTKFDVNEFVTKYDAKKDQILSQAVGKWLPVLLGAPDKVLWGTDISLEGHVSDRVYSRVIDLSNAFAEKVPAQHRQKYLRDNAFNLLGEGAKLTPLTDAELDRLDADEGDEEPDDEDES